MGQDKTYIKAEITLVTGRKTMIEHSVKPGYYESDLAALHEMYGESNVKEVK